jgi:hypothetical protein
MTAFFYHFDPFGMEVDHDEGPLSDPRMEENIEEGNENSYPHDVARPRILGGNMRSIIHNLGIRGAKFYVVGVLA